MKKHKKILLYLILLGSFLILGFQNCAKQPLELYVPSKVYELPKLNLEASICHDNRFFNSSGAKFVFVIDMSASNVGDWISENKNGYDYFYWDKSKATDMAGDRFEAVKYFINNCGAMQGAEFAIIGFSNGAGGLTSPSSPLSCNTVKFNQASAAIQQLDYLKSRQELDKNWFFQWDQTKNKYLNTPTPDSLVLGVTSYGSALSCAENLIFKEFTSSTATLADNYFLFFMSDGVPQDKYNTGCEVVGATKAQKENCYLESTQKPMAMTLSLSMAKAKNLKFSSVYYGADKTIPPILHAMASEGGSSEAIALASFSGDKGALCELFVSQSALEYKPESLSSINLTAFRKGGKIVADSDMDGVDDETEYLLGLDPSNPRSSGVSGVLDGICQRLGGIEKCREKRQQTNCNPNLFNKTGLSDCDYRILGLHHLTAPDDDWGIDTDKDGVLDIVEIIRGTNPAVYDVSSDVDGDGIVARDELLRGSDVFSADQNIPEALLSLIKSEYVYSNTENQCPIGHWKISHDRILATPTVALWGHDHQLSHFNHNTNEHKILITYRSVAQNSAVGKHEYFMHLATVSLEFLKKEDKEIATAYPEKIKPDDFIKIGEVSP